MSLEIFNILFDSEDSDDLKSSKMNFIHQYVGKMFMRGWIEKGIEMGEIDKDKPNEVWGWLKNMEFIEWDNLKETVWKVKDKK